MKFRLSYERLFRYLVIEITVGFMEHGTLSIWYPKLNYWTVGYKMRVEEVKAAWSYVKENFYSLLMR